MECEEIWQKLRSEWEETGSALRMNWEESRNGMKTFLVLYINVFHFLPNSFQRFLSNLWLVSTLISDS